MSKFLCCTFDLILDNIRALYKSLWDILKSSLVSRKLICKIDFFFFGMKKYVWQRRFEDLKGQYWGGHDDHDDNNEQDDHDDDHHHEDDHDHHDDHDDSDYRTNELL